MAQVDIKSLTELRKDKSQSDLFDLFVQHYATPGVPLRGYIVGRSREMRLDLVCRDIYGDISNLQLLQWINDIDNPFSIRQDDFIFWLEVTDIQDAETIDPKILSDNRQNLINAFKATITDPARRKYLDNKTKTQLPATILDDSNTNKIVIENNRISVGQNLFTNPNTQAVPIDRLAEDRSNAGAGDGAEAGLDSALGEGFNGVDPAIPNQNPDQFERVLVRRFIRSSNTGS